MQSTCGNINIQLTIGDVYEGNCAQLQQCCKISLFKFYEYPFFLGYQAATNLTYLRLLFCDTEHIQ